MVAETKVKVGGAWKAIDTIEAKVAGVWKTVLESAVPPEVTVAPTKLINNLRFNATTIANGRVHSDGDLYKSTSTGGYGASYETWLDVGTNDQVWVERTIISGSLTTDAGTGRLACTSIREFGVTRIGSSVGTTECIVDLKFYDAASGGSLLDTQRVTYRAQVANF